MQSEAERIAAGLSEAQQRLLREAFYTNRWRTAHQSKPMFRLGLLTTEHGFAITSLGLAVREVLMRQPVE